MVPSISISISYSRNKSVGYRPGGRVRTAEIVQRIYGLAFERGVLLRRGNSPQVDKETRRKPMELFTQGRQLDQGKYAYADSRPHSA